MEHYAGIDVSLDTVSVCIVDGTGKVLLEAKVVCEPAALVTWFRKLDFVPERIGMEAGPLSQWLHAGMREEGFAVELLETRHVRTAFKTMPVKTDRKDARGIAQLMRMGWFRPVHCKSVHAQEMRALLTTRKLVLNKRIDIEMGLRGILRGFGLKIGPTTPSRRYASAAADVGTWRRCHRVADLRVCHRRPRAIQVIESCWSTFWSDAEAVSVRRDGCDRSDL